MPHNIMANSIVAAENSTLMRIQRDIMEIAQREKELQEARGRLVTNHTASTPENYSLTAEPIQSETTLASVLQPQNREQQEIAAIAVAATTMNNGTIGGGKFKKVAAMRQTVGTFARQQNSAPAMRFMSANGARGVMQKFLKARGKIAPLNALTSSASATSLSAPTTPTQNGIAIAANGFSAAKIPDVETSRITVAPAARGYFVRRDFVPIQERMKREFQEMHHREKELTQLRRSMSSLNLDEINNNNHDDNGVDNNRGDRQTFSGDWPPTMNSLKGAKSMSQLWENSKSDGSGHESRMNTLHNHNGKIGGSMGSLQDGDYSEEEEGRQLGSTDDDDDEAGSNLKRSKQFARSLAELCDAPEDEIFTPGPQAVIMQFENLIRKNQQNRA